MVVKGLHVHGCFSISRKYAKCELDAVAEYCGLRAAEAERERLHDELGSHLTLIDCRIGNYNPIQF